MEQILERFENARLADPTAQIEQFIDKNDHASLETLVEMIRCEIEISAEQSSEFVSIDSYTERFPILNKYPDSLAAIAFEDYRMRAHVGQPVSREKYAEKWNVDVTNWPVWSTTEKQNSSSEAVDETRIDFTTGDSLGEFKIVGELGQGALGKVFLATQGNLSDRLVVLKVTKGSNLEPQFLAELQHTHIMPIFSVHHVNGHQVICMPFLGLATFRDFLSARKSAETPIGNQQLIETIVKKKETQLGFFDHSSSVRPKLKQRFQESESRRFISFTYLNGDELAARLVAQVAEGLAFAHQHRVIHGDIKSSNILISDDGNPLLLDFHLAQFGNEATPHGGTLLYMAPEHLRALQGDGEIGIRCDIYSLGIVLHELLSNEAPFRIPKAHGHQKLIAGLVKVKTDPNWKSSLSNDLSPAFKSIVWKCLDPEPSNRYASAKELATDLNLHLQNYPLKYAPNLNFFERTQKWMKRHPRLCSVSAISVVASIVILVLAGLFLLKQQNYSRLLARQESQTFVESAKDHRRTLTIVGDQFRVRPNSVKSTELFLEQFGASNLDQLQLQDRYQLVDEQQKQRERDSVIDLYYWMTHATLREAMRTQDRKTQTRILNRARHSNARALMMAQRARPLLEQREFIERIAGKKSDAERFRKQAMVAKKIASPQQNLQAAANLVLANRISEAAQLIKSSIYQHPDDYAAWLVLGNTHVQQQDYESAASCFSICIALDPTEGRGHLYRGFANMQLEKNELAYKDFCSAINNGADEYTVLFNRGTVSEKLGFPRRAVTDFDRALEINPESIRASYSRSFVRAELGDRQGAREDLENCIRRMPRFELDWITRGLANVQLGKFKNAQNDFRAALATNRYSRIALQNIAAVSAEHLSDFESAIDALSQLKALAVDDAKTTATRGVIHARAGDSLKAYTDANLALTLKSDNDILYRVAGIYAQTSRNTSEDKRVAVGLLTESVWKQIEPTFQRINRDRDLRPLDDSPEFQKLLELMHWFKKHAQHDQLK